MLILDRVRRSVVAGCAVAAAGAALLVTASPAAAGFSDSTVAPGRRLVAGDEIVTANGQFRVTVQSDGNVVERRGATAVWVTGTRGNPGATLDLQRDGNLVVRARNGKAVWTSGTPGRSIWQLSITEAGELALYNTPGAKFWSNHVGLSWRTSLSAGQSVSSGSTDPYVHSPSGRFEVEPQLGRVHADELAPGISTPTWFRDDGRGGGQDVPSVLTMQTDGNLVLRGSNGVPYWSTRTSGAGNRFTVQDDGNFVVRRPDGSAAWASGTTGILLAEGEIAGPGRRFVYAYTSFDPVYVTVVQPDGNIVQTGKGGQVVWSSHTAGNPGARLTVQTDGNVVLRRPDGRAVWQSGTARCGPGAVYNFQTGELYARGTFAWSIARGHTGVC